MSVTSREDHPTPASLEEGAGVSRSSGPARPPLDPRRVARSFAPVILFGLLILFQVPLCPLKNFFGVPCPGCGLTRATEAMVVGDLWTMLRMHPLAPILAPLALYSVARAVLISAGLLDRDSVDWAGKVPSLIWGGVGVVLVVLWVARLSGFLGGHPDGIHLESGWLVQGFNYLRALWPGA